jgi:hypothetical protein
MTDVSEVLTAYIIIALMMEAGRTSEPSVNFYETTRRNIPEGCHLHTRHCENMKSHRFLDHLRDYQFLKKYELVVR